MGPCQELEAVVGGVGVFGARCWSLEATPIPLRDSPRPPPLVESGTFRLRAGVSLRAQ